MISRRRRWLLDRVREALDQLASGNSASSSRAEIGIVRHASNRAARRRARAWHRRAARRARAASAPAPRLRALGRSPCRRAGTRPRGRAGRAASSVCISRCWKPRSSSAAPLGQRERQRLLIVVAQHEARRPRRSSRRAARCAPRASSRPSRIGAAERDLDVDLDVGGVDAGRIVDRVGVEPHAARAPPRCGRAASRRDWRPRRRPWQRDARAGDADRHRWRGRRPPRRSRVEARM